MDASEIFYQCCAAFPDCLHKNPNRVRRTHQSSRCPLCHCTIIVWKRHGLSRRLLTVLAVADHLKTSHANQIAGN